MASFQAVVRPSVVAGSAQCWTCIHVYFFWAGLPAQTGPGQHSKKESWTFVSCTYSTYAKMFNDYNIGFVFRNDAAIKNLFVKTKL